MKRILIIFLCLTLVIGARFFLKKDSQTFSKALTAQKKVTDDVDWSEGSFINSSSLNGSVEITDKGTANINSLVVSDPSKISVSSVDSDKLLAVDGDTSTYWNSTLTGDATYSSSEYFQVSFGSDYYIDDIRIYFSTITSDRASFQVTSNGTDYNEVGYFGVSGESNATLDGQYRIINIGSAIQGFRVESKLINPQSAVPPEYENMLALWIYDIQFQSNAQATHTTAPTQIDGGSNFWSWDSNTITQSVPANTTATYQYRTSPDGSTWTSWVGDIGSVTNRTGDDSNGPTRYRYLQIEAKLKNTDGISTPSVDQYDITYHTEQKPGAPNAQTVVVQ